ncbi:CxxC motif protein [Haloferax virus Halfgib1]|nr:CxxC motif protein [Haloferax virus Halfgib1]
MSHVRRERHLWRYVRYVCGSCKAWCLVDHAERAAKMRECKDCARIPAIEDEIRDHRLTSLLWAHQLAAETTARTGTAEGGSQSARSGRKQGLAPDPEAGPHEARGRGPRTSGGKAQCRLSDFIRTDGGSRE